MTRDLALSTHQHGVPLYLLDTTAGTTFLPVCGEPTWACRHSSPTPQHAPSRRHPPLPAPHLRCRSTARRRRRRGPASRARTRPRSRAAPAAAERRHRHRHRHPRPCPWPRPRPRPGAAAPQPAGPRRKRSARRAVPSLRRRHFERGQRVGSSPARPEGAAAAGGGLGAGSRVPEEKNLISDSATEKCVAWYCGELGWVPGWLA